MLDARDTQQTTNYINKRASRRDDPHFRAARCSLLAELCRQNLNKIITEQTVAYSRA